jgi:hypothetical protein
LLSLIAMCGMLFATSASAQSPLSQTSIQYVVSPEVPGPGDTVKIEVQGVGTFIGDSTITWKIDGSTARSGIGERSLTFVAGALGSQTTVSVTVVSSEKGTFTKSFTFRPSRVTLLWEADTTAPTLYLGKMLYTAGSTFKVMAVPQVVVGGATVSSGRLSFQWKRNDKSIPDQSGTGRNVITLDGNQLFSEENIHVDLLLDGSEVAKGDVTIPASKPQIRFYELDPLRGTLYDAALISRAALAGKEVTLKAEPYFFARPKSSTNLSFTWTLNGDAITGPDTARGLLTLRQTGSGAGNASLSVALQNTDPTKFVQAAKAALLIAFGSGSDTTSAPSFLGL